MKINNRIAIIITPAIIIIVTLMYSLSDTGLAWTITGSGTTTTGLGFTITTFLGGLGVKSIKSILKVWDRPEADTCLLGK